MTAEASPGRWVGGRYRIVREVAGGGYGRVWEAVDEYLHVDVALKEVRLPPAASSAEHRKRLAYAVREARNAAQLRNHPHIVAVHDVVVEEGIPWTVMRLIDGHSLEQRLKESGPLPVEEVAGIAAAVLTALKAAHSCGITHRDVKPANIMLSSDGEVLLTDFGISVRDADTALTTTGSVIGSAEYMAPERLNSADGPAGDLFSLGATLYHAVEGVSPFKQETPTATLAAVALRPPPHPKRAGRLTRLLASLLAKEPDQRPSPDDALEALAGSAPTKRQERRTRNPPTTDERLLEPADPGDRSGQEEPLFEYSWGTEDELVLRSTVKRRIFFTTVFTACAIGIAWTDEPLSSGYFEFLLAGAGSYAAFYALWWLVAWFDRRKLRSVARQLRVDGSGVSVCDDSGSQHVPWKAIKEIQIRYTDDMAGNHHLLAVHLLLQRTELAVPATLYRPVGWPPDEEMPSVCRDTSTYGLDQPVPICLLGALDTPHQLDFRNTVAAYSASPLQVATDDTGW
ncbi:serine/threonine-protein kinase [Streptomyces xiaopingdaonensis]|uniref:serine/threonine-protein kinase n=1 Tax=Streptomyces xiaopingdaonensis TaxID=1565415 RepID=UPI0012FEA72D|nr:serine/threonine-protein kinase [Streptomyces xiaopingdaonensis]